MCDIVIGKLDFVMDFDILDVMFIVVVRLFSLGGCVIMYDDFEVIGLFGVFVIKEVLLDVDVNFFGVVVVVCFFGEVFWVCDVFNIIWSEGVVEYLFDVEVIE